MRRVGVLGLWFPLLIGVAFVVIAVASDVPAIALLGGTIFMIQGARVAYNHRGVGDRMLAALPATFDVWKSLWYQRQMSGVMLAFLGFAAIYYGSGW